jgi:hypothetical protein
MVDLRVGIFFGVRARGLRLEKLTLPLYDKYKAYQFIVQA